MEAVTKMIQDISFPRQGDYFSLVSNPLEFIGNDGTVTRIKNRSYNDYVFLCIASDANRIVARVAYGSEPADYARTYIFHRTERRFDDVAHLLPALGFTIKE